MIRTLDADSALLTTNLPPVWSLLSVPCQCVWTKGGIRSNSTCPISLVAHTVPTILRPYVFKFMPTAESEEFTSPIVSTLRTSFLPNSSSSCLWPVKHSSERPAVKLARFLRDCRDYYLLLPAHTILSLTITVYIYLSFFKIFVFKLSFPNSL